MTKHKEKPFDFQKLKILNLKGKAFAVKETKP